MTTVAHDILKFTKTIDAPLAEVWAAFADSDERAKWSVPAGDAQVYEESNFQIGGRDVYRCGPPKTLDFHGVLDYIHIVPQSLIVHTDTVTVQDQILATALLTWEFEDRGSATLVRLTDQVTSFVGDDMIEGHRNGHAKALNQLKDFVSTSD